MAINNYGYPMQYPMTYQPQYPVQQTISNTPINVNPQNNSSGIIWVQGEAGAKAFPVQPGNSVLLMDSESDCFYIKSTDASGVPMPLRTFSYTEIIPSKQIRQRQDQGMDPSMYVTRDEFEELKRMLQDRQSNQRRDNRNGEQAFSRNSKQQSNE